jgi:hypothetical protein
MPGLVPGIHVFFASRWEQDVDDRAYASGSDAVSDGYARHDEHLRRQGLTLAIPAAISTPPGTSGLLAFEWK